MKAKDQEKDNSDIRLGARCNVIGLNDYRAREGVSKCHR